MSRLVPLLFALTALASGQVQRGRVATDFAGSVAIFETAASLAGDAAMPVERILEAALGDVSVTAASPLEPRLGGVTAPCTNDSGELRAYSFYRRGASSGLGRTAPLQYTGVVRHVTDGWEVRHPGRVGLSRDGRWAVFAGNAPARTLWVDLWTGAESALPDTTLNVDSVADDGALVATSAHALVVHRPGAEPRTYPLSFEPFAPRIDRHAAFAAVYGAQGLWRVNLDSGAVEPWVRQCDNCQVLDLGPSGADLLYRQWSILYLAGPPGSPPRRLSAEGQQVNEAVLNGAGAKVIASTPDGIVSYALDSDIPRLLVPGPTSLIRLPNIVAPGLWVRLEGAGLAAAEIRLNGIGVQPLRRSSSGLEWVVPADVQPGPAVVEISQPGSPFQPAKNTVEVQLAAPSFVLQGEAGNPDPFSFDWPIISHAATGLPVTGTDPVRPGESITAVMTGLNGHGQDVQWLVNKLYVDYWNYLDFESAGPSPDNPHWTVVRLKVPGELPAGICVLGAIYRKSTSAVLIFTGPNIR